MWIGTGVGILAFLFAALRPALDFGLQAGRTLSGGIAHGHEIAVVVLFGRMLGVLGIGSLFVVMGAVLGTGGGKIVHLLGLDRPDVVAVPQPPAPPPPAPAAATPVAGGTPGAA